MNTVPGFDSSIVRTGMPVWAVVCAGGVETEYFRAGSGDPVLLLLPREQFHENHPVLLAMAGTVRVTAPRAPSGVDFGPWIRDFLDGVGVVPVRVVALGELLDPARQEFRIVLDGHFTENQTTEGILP